MLFFRKHSNEKILQRIYDRTRIKRYLTFLVGMFMMATAFNIFFLPNNIVYGGISGISILTKDYISPALLMLIAGIILLIASYFLLGKNQTAKSVLGSLLFPVFVAMTANVGSIVGKIGNINMSDMLLVAIFGGLIYGIGSGMIFKAGFTSGGTDIINQIFSKYFKVSIGKSMMLTDGVIVLAGVFVLKDWSPVMYAIIVLYIISLMADRVMLGISESKAFYIVTEKEEEVREYILENLNHGVTIIDAKGGFTGDRQKVLMCVLPTKEYFKFKEGIYEIDNDVFFVVMDAYEVSGGA